MESNRRDIYELNSYLCKVFEDRISLSVKKNYGSYYYLVGKFDEIPISFEYVKNDGFLFVSSSNVDDYFFDELIPIISLFMGDKSPVAKYSNVDSKKSIIGNTIEWCDEVDNRVRTLKRNESSQEYEITNLITFIETTEEREKRLGFTELIPMFFPDGRLDDLERFSNMVDEYSEQDAFLALKGLRSVFFQVQIGKREDFSIDECNKALYIILSKISSFSNVKYDDPVKFFYSEDYAKWNRKWNEYFKYDVRCQYMEEKLRGNDTFYFYPECAKILKFERSMKLWEKK